MNPWVVDNTAPTPEQADRVRRLARTLYFRSRAYTRVSWLGVQAVKSPMDLWVYQEIITALGVDLLIETGTAWGGSALFFAHVFELLGRGKVLTIDRDGTPARPTHPRIEYLAAPSLARQALARAAERARAARTTMVVLDSDHRAPHVVLEMQAYAPLVSPGSYLVVEDTVFDDGPAPARPEYGPGPALAVREFLRTHPEFAVDTDAERHLLTFAGGAFLRRDSSPLADDQQALVPQPLQEP